LVVYDCYRPVRSVQAFITWVKSGPGHARGYYHPRIDRHRLLELGYIARRSGHSRGHAVDLSITAIAKSQPTGSDTAIGDCTDTTAKTDHRQALDMGTEFDCFDVRSQITTSLVGPAATAARQRLVRLMSAEGFRNYAKEWWHFTYPPGDSGSARDFPVKP
jgi:zinc D-Ala-D-Ala dipeptidase